MFNHVYLNGEITPKAEAKISPFDRGFLYSDSIYETLSIYQGRPYLLQNHIDRLNDSLKMLEIPLNWSNKRWAEAIELLLTANDCQHQDAGLYAQVSRGISFERQHVPIEGMQPTVFMMLKPRLKPDADTLAKGFSAITTEDLRWQHCDIKTTGLLANVIATQQAQRHNAIDAILVRDGTVTEAASSNIFVVHQQQLITPALSRHLLPGITRDHLIKLAKQAGLPVEQRDIDESMLCQAEEIILTGSTREIVPVVCLDGETVGTGQPGPRFQQLAELYQRVIDQFIAEFA